MDAVVGTGTFLQPGVHQIIEGSWPWLTRAQKWCRLPLGVYRHSRTKRFVLGAWLVEPRMGSRPVMQELTSFSGDPHAWWPHDLMDPEDLRRRLRPIDEVLEERQRLAKERADAKKRQAFNDREHQRGLYHHFRRRGMEATAKNIRHSPIMAPGSANEGMEDAMGTLGRLA